MAKLTSKYIAEIAHLIFSKYVLKTSVVRLTCRKYLREEQLWKALPELSRLIQLLL